MLAAKHWLACYLQLSAGLDGAGVPLLLLIGTASPASQQIFQFPPLVVSQV